MRVTLVLLIIGVSLCAASMRKRRSTLMSKRAPEIDLCGEIANNNGKVPPWMTQCDGGNTCIFTDWLCDDQQDCKDGSDENRPDCADDEDADLCTEIDENGVVPYWMRVCEDQAKCVFEDWVCDGEPDCFDSSDEKDCSAEEPVDLCDYLGTPESEKWLKECKTGGDCILSDWMCDKEEDCKDGSDERKNHCEKLWDDLDPSQGYRSGKKRRR